MTLTTASVRERLLLLLQEGNLGLHTIAILCDSIAGDARFNIWFLDVGKKQNEEQALHLLEGYEELSEQCLRAVDKFTHDRDAETFNATMQRITKQLAATMK